jgi:ubiquinone/menaquinone biosynthesis C-methylase UbiE
VPDVYTHGHQDSVLRSHTWRTAENSAGYLLPELAPSLDLLDVGCGPGTITLDLARRVAPGQVLGIDASAEVIERAEAARVAAGAENVRFTTGDVYTLEIGDASVDIAHAHQVLQHLSEPVRALRELRRVLRPDGLLAVRDSDYGAFTWAPATPLLDRWNDLYHQVTVHNDADADAGRHLAGWVRSAGYRDLTVTSSTWTFADADSRAWWGGLWADRCADSGFALQAVDYGLSDPAELASIAGAWREWTTEPDGFFMVPHVEVLAHP